MKALRVRLEDDAVVGLLLPPGASPRDVDAAERDARSVFGAARVADLPKGVLVLCSRREILADATQLIQRLRRSPAGMNPRLEMVMGDDVHWRPAPSAK